MTWLTTSAPWARCEGKQNYCGENGNYESVFHNRLQEVTPLRLKLPRAQAGVKWILARMTPATLLQARAAPARQPDERATRE